MRPDRPPITTFRRELLRVVEGGIKGSLLGGTDVSGRTTAPLRPATMRRRSGSGPPRAPHGESSRMVRGVQVNWTVGLATNEAVLEARNTCPFSTYLEQGTRRMVARPSLGILPAMRREIESLADRLPASVLGQAGGF